MGTGNKTGIIFSNKAHFDFKLVKVKLFSFYIIMILLDSTWS